MSENSDQENKKDIFQNMEWRELDTAVRKWVVFTNFQKDLDKYWENADFGSHDPI